MTDHHAEAWARRLHLPPQRMSNPLPTRLMNATSTTSAGHGVEHADRGLRRQWRSLLSGEYTSGFNSLCYIATPYL